MIPRLLFLSFIIFVCQGFAQYANHHSTLYHPTPHELSFPSSCPANQIQIAKAAVITCQKDKLPDTSDCMGDQMRKYKLQCWNVLVRSSEDVADIVSYWAPGSCIIKLDNFGQKFNRSYLLWQQLNYNNETNSTEYGSKKYILLESQPQTIYHKYTEGLENYEQPKQLSPQQSDPQSTRLKTSTITPEITTNSYKRISRLRGDCQQWKINSVRNLIQYCDLAGNEGSGHCIRDRIKDQMGEYWNVYIKTTINSGLTIWFAECYTTLQGYGTYTRYIRVWT